MKSAMINELTCELSNNGSRDTELDTLVVNSIRGDSEALCRLCERLTKSVLLRTKHILGAGMDAEDVAQNILIRVCEKIQNLREPKAFKAWLAKIEANETKRYFSDKSFRGEVQDISDFIDMIQDANADAQPAERTEHEDSRCGVMEVLSCLPERQREAVMLRYFEDWSITEIARKMAVSHQSVTRYLAIAREKLTAEVLGNPRAAGHEACACRMLTLAG